MKFFSLILIVFCLLSCNNKESGNLAQQEQTIKPLVSKSDIETIKYLDFILDQKVTKKIDGWEKYYELEQVIEKLKQADFSFFINNSDIIEALITELKNTIPESVNSSAIYARLTTLETALFKLESELNLSHTNKKDTLLSIKELLVSFSNLNLQMNKKIERESQHIQRPK